MEIGHNAARPAEPSKLRARRSCTIAPILLATQDACSKTELATYGQRKGIENEARPGLGFSNDCLNDQSINVAAGTIGMLNLGKKLRAAHNAQRLEHASASPLMTTRRREM
jgi:hypothetical protein